MQTSERVASSRKETSRERARRSSLSSLATASREMQVYRNLRRPKRSLKPGIRAYNEPSGPRGGPPSLAAWPLMDSRSFWRARQRAAVCKTRASVATQSAQSHSRLSSLGPPIWPFAGWRCSCGVFVCGATNALCTACSRLGAVRPRDEDLGRARQFMLNIKKWPSRSPPLLLCAAKLCGELWPVRVRPPPVHSHLTR